MNSDEKRRYHHSEIKQCQEGGRFRDDTELSRQSEQELHKPEKKKDCKVCFTITNKIFHGVLGANTSVLLNSMEC